MFRLSVCAETVLRNLPLAQRAKEIARAGFLVEFWAWHDRGLEAIATEPGVRISAFPGYMGGSLVHPDGLPAFMDGVRRSLAFADKLGCRQLFISTGEISYEGKIVHPIAAHPATRWITAYKGLCQVAELAEKYGAVYNLEQLNTKVDHAGYPLRHAEDVVRLLEQVGSPRVKLLLDIYHVQIEEGNLIEVIHASKDYIGYVHVADVPGRHEPGTGEINFPRVVQALRQVGYEGTVGLEAFPEGDDHRALARFKEVFGG
jgi:hydroxypyruvate isomerase